MGGIATKVWCPRAPASLRGPPLLRRWGEGLGDPKKGVWASPWGLTPLTFSPSSPEPPLPPFAL